MGEIVALTKIKSKKTIRDILSCTNLKKIFRIKNRLCTEFTFNDKISTERRSLLRFKFYFGSCNATYYVMVKP